MVKTVLITGATGLIGKRLTHLLLSNGYTVHSLSRKAIPDEPGIKTFLWNPERGTIDEKCLKNVEAVIHLAGEGIAAKPWTKLRKQQIIKSRTDTIRLLYKAIRSHPSSVNTVISASAVGYYGDRGNELLAEGSRPGNDFMAQTCIAWENAVNEGKALNLRVIKLRTGMVLSKEGGALPQLAAPVRLGLGTVLGSGEQWVPWIHLDDVVSMYLFVLENNEARGTFNQTAPHPVTNKEFTTTLARKLKRPLWLPKVPAFALRLILGEMKAVVLSSTKTSAGKITDLGFQFQYSRLDEALKNLYDRK